MKELYLALLKVTPLSTAPRVKMRLRSRLRLRLRERLRVRVTYDVRPDPQHRGVQVQLEGRS